MAAALGAWLLSAAGGRIASVLSKPAYSRVFRLASLRRGGFDPQAVSKRTNEEIAKVFDQLAGYEAKYLNPFAGKAFQKTAAILRKLSEPFDPAKPTESIGKSSTEIIKEFLSTGSVARLANYEQQYKDQTAAPSAWRENSLQLGKPAQNQRWKSQTHMQKHRDIPASFFSWFATLLPRAHINESHCITSEAADILLRHRGFFEQLRKERNAARSRLSQDHEDLAKIRKLITSKDEGAFLLALRLLHSTNASEEMWCAALPKSRLRLVSGQLHEKSYAGWQRFEAELALFEAAAEKPVFHAHLFSSYGRTMRLAVRDLSVPVARILALFRGDMDLDDLESVTDSAAEALGVHQGDLSLDGLTTLSATAAKFLAEHKGSLSFYGLESVTDAAAEALSVHQGDLSLDGLTTLSATAAKSLAEHKGSLSFYGLKSLSAEVAEALAVHGGYIGLGDEARAALECAKKRLARI